MRALGDGAVGVFDDADVDVGGGGGGEGGEGGGEAGDEGVGGVGVAAHFDIDLGVVRVVRV